MSPHRAPSADRRAFRLTLARVLVVQLVTVFLLWLLQSAYTR
ncbi:MAG TPA: hypothetical protein VFZ24_07510 [Longimicrobiales bacterium]